LNSSNTAMVLGPVTLGSNATINTNATSTAGDITLGAITLAGYNLTLQTGTGTGTSAADISGTSVSGLGGLALQSVGGTVRLTGSVSASSFTVASTVNNLSLTGSGGTVTNAVTFSNTGTLVLGQAGGNQYYTNGLIATAPSSVTLYGRFKAVDSALTFNAIRLGANVTLDADPPETAGTITIGAITGGGFDLTFGSANLSAYDGVSITIENTVN
ncbi:MAG: hypothetical protein JZU63_11435, partial [Rhodoferax sp.]|nr:hypothetical protein [Rhodoferax sp.]